MNQQQLRQVYEMVDGIPFTRSKKNINRDFSDAVMMAELVHHYRPKTVELHSYPAASSVVKKIANWQTLNSKVLKRMGIGLNKKQIQDIVNCVPLAIQSYLFEVLRKFQSPAEEVNLRQQIKKSQTNQSKPRQASTSNNNQNSIITVTNIQSKEAIKQLKSQPNLTLGTENDEQIEVAYGQLLKLQEKSKMKDQVIKNLQKKIQKMVFG